MKEPINYGDLDPQQRLDVARGEKLNVECNCAWNPDRHADSCPVNLRDRLTDAQARLAEKDARIAQLAAHARGKNKALAQRDAEVERLNREANNDAIAYKAVIERQKEIREERDILQKQLDRFNSQSHGIPALSEIEKLRARLAALESQQAARVGGERDREADRKRFPDPLFNKWLDESITDNGEYSVWDQVGDTCAAWHGWENRQFYVDQEYAELRARAALSPAGGGVVPDAATLKFALAELHKCGVKPGGLPHMVLTNLIDQAKPQANSQEVAK